MHTRPHPLPLAACGLVLSLFTASALAAGSATPALGQPLRLAQAGEETAPRPCPTTGGGADDATAGSSAAIDPQDSPGPAPDDGGLQLSVGLMVGSMPRYMGSKKSHVLTAPVLSVSWGPFFADPLKGIGVGYQTPWGQEISLTVGPDAGRADKNETFYPGSDRLRGMGKIESAFAAIVGPVDVKVVAGVPRRCF